MALIPFDGELDAQAPGLEPFSGKLDGEPETGDFMRGLKQYGPQMQNMWGAGKAIVGKAVNSNPLIESGIASMKEADAKMKQIGSKPYDEFTGITGIGDAVDWAQHGLGQVTGNVLESGATALAGAAIGGLGGGNPLTAAVGGATGLVGKSIVKGVLKDQAEAIAAKYGVQEAEKFAAKNIGRTVGMNTALGAGAVYHGLGETGSRAIEEANYDMNNVDLGKVVPAAGAHAVGEYIGDKFLLKGLTEKGGYRAAGNGIASAAKTISGNAAIVAGKEIPVEMFQTEAERYAAGLPLANKEAGNELLNTAAQTALFGIAGVPAGVRAYNAGEKQNTNSVQDTAPPVNPNVVNVPTATGSVPIDKTGGPLQASVHAGVQSDAIPTANPLLLGYNANVRNGDPLVTFPDGTTMTRSEYDRYSAEQEQARLDGMIQDNPLYRMAERAKERTNETAADRDLANLLMQERADVNQRRAGITADVLKGRAERSQNALEGDAAQDELAPAQASPIERMMQSRNDQQLESIAANESANANVRQAAVSEIQRRVSAPANQTTTAQLEQKATQFTPPPPSIRMLQAQLEKTEPFSEASGRLTDLLQTAVTKDAERTIASGEMPVYRVTDHVSVAIHPSAQNPGMVQVTRYTKDGVIGDSQYNNIGEAVTQEGLTHKPRIPSGDAIKAIEQSIAAEAEYQRKKGIASAAQPAQMDTTPPQADGAQARIEQGAAPQAVARIDKQSVYSSPDDGESAPDDVKRNALGLPEGYTFATGKDSKEKVAASSLRVGDILSVDGRIVSVDNVVQKDDGTVDLLIGSTGGKSTYNVSPDRILERRKVVKSETTAAETKPKTLTVGAMPNTAPGKSGISKGAAGIAQRQANAANNFIESVQEQFGLSKEDAGKAWDHFVKNKLVKIDAVGGQYTLTDGRLWDGDVMRQAANTVTAPAQAEASQQPSKKAAPVKGPQSRDDLVGAILRVTGGKGIAANMAQTIVGDKANQATKVRGLFQNQGTMDLDDTAELLRVQENYDVRDGNRLAELIRQQAGGDPVYSMDRVEREAAANVEREYRDRIRKSAKKFGIKTVARPFNGIEQEVLRTLERRHNEAVAKLDARAKSRFDAMLKHAIDVADYDEIDAIVADAQNRFFGRQFWIEATKQLRGYIDDLTIERQAQENTNNATDQEETQGAEPDWLRDTGPERTGGRGAADRVDQTPPAGLGEEAEQDFGLAAQTNEQAAEQFAQQQAEKEKEAADKKAAEAKDKADAEANDFRLAGSDRAADVAVAGGQQDIFSKAAPATNGESPVAQSAQDNKPAAVFKSDVPNDRWLNEQIDYAKSKPRNEFGVPYMGKTTGYFKNGNPLVSVDLLASIKGERGEQNSVRKDSLDWLLSEMKSNGLKNVGIPYVEVGYDGVPWVSEGNHRIMAAKALGWETMPVEIRYFDGGERKAKLLSPDSVLGKESKPSAVDAKKEAETEQEIANEVIAEAESIEPINPAEEGERIGDFGRKVMVRKDTAQPTGKRVSLKENDERPVWIRKYHAMQISDSSYLRDKSQVGKWQLTEESKAMRGAVRAISSARFATEQDAMAALPLIVAQKKHRIYGYTSKAGEQEFAIFRNITEKKRAMVRGGFKTHEEAAAYLKANPVEIIEHKFGEPERPWLDRIERIGPDRLTGNVTKQMFEKTFAPSGVVYGNWLLNSDGTVNSDGQELSNHIYNSLLDLADAINVPPKALFLNGKMALGIGADGKGGKNSAAAHYSPSKALINLTKIKGAGTLAHEWWHAVDHYFADTSGKPDSDSVVSAGYSPSRTTARPELVEAIKNIVDTMMYSESSQTTDAEIIKKQAQKRIDSAVRNIEYYVRDLRSLLADGTYNKGKKVATKEQLAQFDALADRLKNGDGGAEVYIENPSRMRGAMGFMSNEVMRDMNALYKSVTGRSFLKQDPQSTGRRLMWDVNAVRDNKEKLDTKEAETKTVKGRSSYYIEAKRIDQQHVGDYWSSPEEMGARAFESYIFDKITEQGNRSDYLVHGVENRYYAPMDMYPYPEGAERKAINKAFDALFDTIQSKETDKGTALYSFAGQSAATADTHALATAQARLNVGEDAETVRQETGWFQGADGQWRFEINDADASLKKPYPSKGQKWGDVWLDRIKAGESSTLGSMLDHPALFAAYPQLADIPVSTMKGNGASYSVESRQIDVGKDVPMYEIVSMLMHEIQHGIQTIEGFASGGTQLSKKEIDNLYVAYHAYTNKAADVAEKIRGGDKSKETRDRLKQLMRYQEDALRAIDRGSRDSYMRLSGEIEARNVQSRLNMSDEQRREQSPESTQDVSNADAIVVMNGKVMDAAPANVGSLDVNAAQAPMPKAQATSAIGRILGDKATKALIDAGLIRMVDSEAQIPGGSTNIESAGHVLGATMPDGTIYLNLGALNESNIAGVFKHEGFHASAREWLGEQSYSALMNRLERLRTIAQSKVAQNGPLGKWYENATAAIPANTREADRNEELAGYAIEQYSNGEQQPSVIRKWVEDFLSALRVAIIKHMPNGKVKMWALNNLQPQDLARIAVAGMKAKASGMQAQGREAMAYSNNANLNRNGEVFYTQISGNEIGRSPGATIQEKASNWMRANLQGKSFKNDATGWDISVGRKGINKSMMHSSKDIHARSVTAIPSLLNNAILVSSEPNNNVKERESVPLVHHFYAPLIVGNREYIARMVIKEATDGRRFYDYETSDEISPAVSDTTLPFTQRMGAASGARLTMSMDKLLSHVKKEHGGTDSKFSKINQTDTPAFKKWFGDSKVVDADGKPLVVYHGTDQDFNEFSFKWFGRTDAGARGKGFYFSENPEYASRVADSVSQSGWGNANVMPVYLKAEHPFEWDGQNNNLGMSASSFSEWLRKNKYDSVHNKATGEWVVLAPTQIKSAVGNNGNFDATNPDIRYSRAQNPTLSHALDLVSNFTGPSAKTFGSMKNVQTQLHKARKDPEHFGKVFNLAMDFRTGVSRSAYRAWEQAKDILPAYDDIASATKAVLHGNKTSKELGRVAKWIFDGTTYGGASPLAGMRWTPEQLRSNFNATEKEIELYEQARGAIDSSLTEVANSVAWKIAKPHLNPLMKSEITNNSEGAQGAMLEALSFAEHGAEGKAKESIAKTIESVNGIYAQANALKDAGYAPLSRFGRYTVDVFKVDANGKIARDANGTPQRIEFQKFEFESEAKAAAKQLEKTYANDKSVVVKRGVQAEKSLFSGVDPETVSLFVDQVAEIPGLDVKREVLDEWRRQAVSQRSALMHNIKRKGMAGYSEDLPRTLATFITSNARYASSNFHMGDMQEAIADIPDTKGDVRDEAKELYDYINANNEPGAWMRGMMFAWYLGGSPAAAAVNLTQPVLVTAPYLSQFGSPIKHLMSSIRQSMQPKLVPLGLRGVLRRAMEDGIVEAQEIHHLYDAGMKPLIARLPGGENVRARAQGAATLWGALFGMAENFNRRLSFLSAYKMGQELGEAKLKEKGFADAYEFAKRAVEETQGIYAKENRPNWARGTGALGAVGVAGFTFKQYSIQYVELLSRMAKSGPEGKKSALLMLGILVLASGMQGLPGADDLDDLIDTVLQSMGYMGNSKKAKRDFLKEVAGERIADIVMYGLSAETPIDVQSRLGLGNLFPATGVFKPSEQNKAGQFAELLGPPGGMARSVGDFVDAVQSGQNANSFAALSPVFVRNVAKAAQMAETGEYKDSRGRKVEEVDTSDSVIKGIGFQPQHVASASRKAQMVRQDVARVRDAESDIASIWAQGLASNDRDEVARAKERLARWNENNPTTPIRITPQQIMRRVIEIRSERSSRMEKSAPQELRGYVRDAIR